MSRRQKQRPKGLRHPERSVRREERSGDSWLQSSRPTIIDE
jgi:hypothetical protein